MFANHVNVCLDARPNHKTCPFCLTESRKSRTTGHSHEPSCKSDALKYTMTISTSHPGHSMKNCRSPKIVPAGHIAGHYSNELDKS